MLAIAVVVLLCMVFDASLLITSILGWVVGMVIGGALLRFLALQTAYDIVINDDTKTVSVPKHNFWGAYTFGFDEVTSIGVDWSRGHGQRAVPDAPISYIGISLDASKRPQTPFDDHPVVSIHPGGLSHEQSRALVLWLQGRVAPHAELGQLEPD